MRSILFVLASLLTASIAFAGDGQSGMAGSTTFSPFAGAYIPTGSQHRVLSRAFLTGAQVGYDVVGPLRIVGSVAWTPDREREFADARINLYQYDLGAELKRRAASENRWSLEPFIGAGAGGRSYRFKSESSLSQSDFDGYGSLGGEMARSRLGAKVEVRDYLSQSKPFPGETGSSSTRNDLVVTGALTFHM